MMTPEQAAWVEQHVITDYHLANEDTWNDPEQDRDPECACQRPCSACRDGQHDPCRKRRNSPDHSFFYRAEPETFLRAPAPWRPTDPKRPLYLKVWLASRACRPLCTCPQCAPSPADRPPLTPIASLTGYHLPWLLMAEAGTLTYDPKRYPVHGVPNNAMTCYWAGLLADGEDGMVLTEIGRARLQACRSSPAGRAWIARYNSVDCDAGDVEKASEPPPRPAPPPQPAKPEQLDLFAVP